MGATITVGGYPSQEGVIVPSDLKGGMCMDIKDIIMIVLYISDIVKDIVIHYFDNKK
jgi:hypothetical protein